MGQVIPTPGGTYLTLHGAKPTTPLRHVLSPHDHGGLLRPPQSHLEAREDEWRHSYIRQRRQYAHSVRSAKAACSRTYGLTQGRTGSGLCTTSTTRGYATEKRWLSRSITFHHPYRSVPTQARTRFRTSPPGAVRDLAAPRSGPKIDPPLVPPPSEVSHSG